MSSRKRKRYSRDIKCVFFPDDIQNALAKVGREPSSLSSLSSAKSWEKCGDSFLDSPVTKIIPSSGRKLSTLKKLKQLSAAGILLSLLAFLAMVHLRLFYLLSNLTTFNTLSVGVAELISAFLLSKNGLPDKRHKIKFTALAQLFLSFLDDLPVIDTDSDLGDESQEDVEKHSGQQISDCDSSEEKPNDFPSKTEDVKELEISGYVSDGEDIGSPVTSSRLDSEIFHLQTGEGSKKSISNWVRSAQAMLQTPQKPVNIQPKTPEDSAKKRRKFQSGGLAERLNRLQCRQRSAISFWKHQSVSDSSAATTTTVDRAGVLVLEVLEVHEECSMQLAHCKHHQPPGDGHQHINPVSEESARMLVLFNRETAAQLIPAPSDIVHIYPPWQHLSVEGFSCPIILNTHFSKKVFCASKSANASIPRGPVFAERRMPYYLGKTFGVLDACRTTEESNGKQVAQCSLGPSGVLTRYCVSLLEAIEGLGQAGSVEQDVEVVVQRVYSIPIADCSPVSILKPRLPLRSSTAPPAEKGKTRLCVLVQDSYGMFSVVQLQLLPCEDDLSRYCQMWQGKTCMLRGIKVVQRVTRERSSRLFSLIDSLWPPAMPLKDHGDSLSMPSSAGMVVGVDESTAYSWPACNLCGSDNLELSAERPQKFHCVSCKSAVDKPHTKTQLEVFLTSSSLSNCTMKVKLQQRTIMTILNAAEVEGGEFPGYDVEAVLGKEVGPIPVYVRVITRKPALWMGLEEICL
ncbi:DNA repair-scaffolding protein [Neolamprologus brichardi]|uniref:DNA repair-scaffolding protein n=1 Tax=Neolamprologus brichardi TaxID=32507 RepID=UPI0016439D9F|nr:DNA repair-scaffolding protein [Neolamprologus brichardi]